MRWQLLKKGTKVTAMAEPIDGDMRALIIMEVDPGQDLGGIPYQQLFDAAPGMVDIDMNEGTMKPVP